jgi:hypothetical protein
MDFLDELPSGSTNSALPAPIQAFSQEAHHVGTGSESLRTLVSQDGVDELPSTRGGPESNGLYRAGEYESAHAG